MRWAPAHVSLAPGALVEFLGLLVASIANVRCVACARAIGGAWWVFPFSGGVVVFRGGRWVRCTATWKGAALCGNKAFGVGACGVRSAQGTPGRKLVREVTGVVVIAFGIRERLVRYLLSFSLSFS